MRSLRPAVTAAAFVLLLSTGSAFAADTAWDVLKSFGLTGVWSAACTAPTTGTNFRYIYSRDANGGAVRELDFGVNRIYATAIESAELFPPSTLKLRIRNTDPKFQHLNHLVLEIVLIKEINSKTSDMRVRFIESSDSAGQVFIKGGFVGQGAQTRVGKPTSWQYKCRGPMT